MSSGFVATPEGYGLDLPFLAQRGRSARTASVPSQTARAAAPSAITTSAASWRAASAAAAAIPSSASDSRRKSAPMARRWPAGLGVVRGGVVGEGLVPLALVLAVALALLVLEQVVLLGMRLLVEFLVGHAPSMPQTPRLESPSRTEGRSSIGRAPVSKTGGCRFESCRPCPSSSGQNPLRQAGFGFSAYVFPEAAAARALSVSCITVAEALPERKSNSPSPMTPLLARSRTYVARQLFPCGRVK